MTEGRPSSLESFAFVVLVGAILGPLSTVYVAATLDVDGTAWIARHRAARVGAQDRGRRGVLRS